MFASTFGAVILASVLLCLVTAIGTCIISKYEEWGKYRQDWYETFR
jgi:hypothetical protein